MKKDSRVLTIRGPFSLLIGVLGFHGVCIGENADSILNEPAAEIHQNYAPSVKAELGDLSQLKAQAQALYAEATRIESSEGFQQALPLFYKVLELDPGFSTLVRRLAFDYLVQDQPQQALSLVLKGLESNPRSTSLMSLSAWIYSSLKQHREAIRIAHNTLNENFEELDAYRALYQSQKALGLDQENQQLLERLAKIPSKKVKFWNDLASAMSEIILQDPQIKKPEIIRTIAPLYQQALKLEPENSEHYKRWGDFYVNIGEIAKGIETYEKGLTFEGDDLELMLRLGRAQHRIGKVKDAYKTFQQIYELKPELLKLAELLANLALSLGEREKAIEYFEASLRLSPQNEVGHRSLLKLYRELKQSERAIRYYENLVLQFQGTDFLFDSLDDLYESSQQYSKGVQFFEKYIEKYPNTIRPLLLLVSYYEKTKILESKVAFFEKMMETHPKEVHFYTVLISIYLKLNQSLEVERLFDRLMASDVQTEESVQQYVSFLMREKKHEKILQVFKTQRERYPDSVTLAVFHAVYLRQQKQYQQAFDLFTQILDRHDEKGKKEGWTAEFYLEWGLTQELAEKRGEAEKTFQRALEIYPTDPRLQNALAYLWAEDARQLDEALVLSKKSLETKPQEGAYLDTLAWIYYKMGRLDEALPLLEQAKSLTHDDPEVLSHLAEIYHKLGRIEEALNHWKLVLEKDPQFNGAKENMLTLQEELKQSKAHVKTSP